MPLQQNTHKLNQKLAGPLVGCDGCELDEVGGFEVGTTDVVGGREVGGALVVATPGRHWKYPANGI